MKLTVYREEELEKARQLQKEARNLHLPIFPVVTWEAEKFAKNGKKVDHVLSKSNSYVRNGLNIMSVQSAYGYLAGSSYAGGSFALKNLSGIVRAADFRMKISEFVISSTSGETYFSLVAGYGDTAESLDDYVLANEFGDGSSENQLSHGKTVKSAAYSSNKFICSFVRLFGNAYTSSQDIKEMGLKLNMNYSTSQEMYLAMRDILDPAITLAAGESVLLHYKFEVLY